MKNVICRALVAATVGALAVVGCTDPGEENATGTVTLHLVGQSAGGTVYRLRDATIDVTSATYSHTWNTEDDPDRTSLSEDVVIGAYNASLRAGWRLEKLAPPAPPETVPASLITANPAAFAVTEGARTRVPLRFRVADGDLELDQGYDIEIEIEEPAPPAVAIAPVASPSNDSTPTIAFSVSPATATSQCSLDGAAFAPCTSPVTLAPVADGSHTFTVRAIQGTRTGQGSVSFVVDTVAPGVTITAGPTGPINTTTATFAFTTSGGATATTCRIDAGAPVPCMPTYTASSLTEGAHTFTVTAVDGAGNATSASRAFTVDLTAPTVTITGGPAGPTSDSTPTFTFTTGGAPATTQCRIDTAAFAACTTPYTPAVLADGAHVVEVRVIDAAGNVGSATRAFTVDTIAPTVTITGGPAGPTNDSTPTFTFATGGAPTTIQCRIDSAAFAACTSPYTAAVLPNGAHVFEVRVIDGAGNVGSATRAFTVDTVAPSITMSASNPTAVFSLPAGPFAWTSAGQATTECRVYRTDQAAPGPEVGWVSCASGWTTNNVQVGNLPYRLEVRVRDAAGNQAVGTHNFMMQVIL